MNLHHDETENFKYLTVLYKSNLWIPVLSYILAQCLPIPTTIDQTRGKAARLGIFIGCLCGFYALTI
ncbi:hypothetical protein LCDV1gp098 [Lymphocystis disease virus 1]|uniref:hypothetical protein n=1 Tax=Fish lymphocystis disease virus TaxID=36363 RepID=UPI0000161F04|nr:hypothetical protein LCDV1gp098 [Lymphocystis disease virus 1]